VKRRHHFEAAAASVVGGFVGLLPRRAALGFGRALGRLWGALDRRHLEVAVANLRAAFPDWDDAKLHRTARGVYQHFGTVLIDILWLSRRSRPELEALIEITGREHVTTAMARGKGVINTTAHLGNWELHGVGHGLCIAPLGLVARPLDNPALDARLCAFRTAFGNTVIYKRKALSQVLRLLRDGKGVALLLDQNVHEQDGIFITFFGRPAATTTVAAALALKTGSAIVPSRTELLPDGRYRLSYEPALALDPEAPDRDAEIARVTQLLATRTEAWIRDTPEQWLWIHKRWKTQPSAISNQPSGDGKQGQAGSRANARTS
jgi:KDO2-lipid IV(A) lauroyltransferase